MAKPIADLEEFENEDEQLDFEDENFSDYPVAKDPDLRGQSFSRFYRSEENTSGVDESITSADEGELKSEEETDINEEKSSEEGEVSSELEEMELVGDRSPAKETPWERGLRLARERLERAKLMKATEKDLAEKRMNLEVPNSAVDTELEKVTKEDVFWPNYYQAFAIGRTELTGHRFLPEDLLPPTAFELSEWRRGLEVGHRSRGQHRRRRATSPSASSSESSSSRFSSSSWSSDVSSLASVAVSWKAKCAKAMKDYLGSPLDASGRRRRYAHTRWRRGQRSHSSRSSGSSSRSSDSRSPSDVSRNHKVTGVHGHLQQVGKLSTQGVRRMWPEESHRSRRGRKRSSSRSRTRSGSSHDSSDGAQQDVWKYGSRSRKNGDSDMRSTSEESSRDRREVPPLPHERPIKRPWVAAPGLASASATLSQNRPRARSSSQSHSDSPPNADEKRFITSWSRSPSSGDERRVRDPVRRERLPDVVPGNHTLLGATPRKKKSRSPFAGIRGPSVPSTADIPSRETIELTAYSSAQQSTTSAQQPHLNLEDYGAASSLPDPPPPMISSYVPPISTSGLDTTERTDSNRTNSRLNHESQANAPSQTGGELPLASNRPGVRLTLAPRLKASAVGIASLTGVSSRPSNRPFQPSPPAQSRAHRLPLPPSLVERGSSPGASAPNPAPLTAEQIRIQAEAAAAIVEARERRRAAAEAARRHRNPNRKKRNDLSKIPIRGRPTYRRQSFSSMSSSSSGRSSRSRSPAASSVRSKSASRSRSTSPQTPDSRCDDPYGLSNRPDYQPRAHQMRRGGGPRRVGQFNFPKDDFREQPDDYFSSKYNRSAYHGTELEQSYTLPSHTAPGDSGLRVRTDYDRIDRGQTSYRHKASYEPGERYRMPYKTQSMQIGQGYPSDVGDAYPMSRHRSDLKAAVHNANRYGPLYDDSDQQHYPVSSRRVIPQTSFPGERVIRPRTPHGDYDEPMMDRRSPRLNTDTRIRGADRLHSRKDDRDLDVSLGAPIRKRACIVAPPEVESSIFNPEMRRARTRHRSRGPGGSGAPIDRSEPFESDAGSFAAEQRLRELRERLNMVDDRIAEIKACSAR